MNFKKIFSILIFLFLVLSVSLVFAAESSQSSQKEVNYGSSLGLDKTILVGKGDTTCKEDSNKENSPVSCTFDKSGASVNINGAVFTNIQEQNRNRQAYIRLDRAGNLQKADFITGNKEGSYIFGNKKINVPANSHVLFDVNGGLTIEPPKGSTYNPPTTVSGRTPLKHDTIRIKGENIKLPDGYVLNSGEVSYINGKAYVLTGKSATVNGIKITADSNPVQVKFGERATYFLKEDEEDTGNFVRVSEKKVSAGGEGVGLSLNPSSFVESTLSKTSDQSFNLNFDQSRNKRYFSVGDKGAEVEKIQQFLVDNKYLEENQVDGAYGPITQSAVIRWQKKNGLSPDGRFGVNSLAKAGGSFGQTVSFSLNKGTTLSVSGEGNRLKLDVQGEQAQANIGGTSLKIFSSEEGPQIFKNFRTASITELDVPVDLSIRDKEGNEISTHIETPGPGPLATLKDFQENGVGNRGYFTSSYKTSVHERTVIYDNFVSDDSLVYDRGIQSNTAINDDNLENMQRYCDSLPKGINPDERFNLVVRKAGEITNYNPEQSLRLIGVFGSRYKDLSPNPEEGYGNRQLVNGHDSSEYKQTVPPMSSEVAKELGVLPDSNADKKYRMILIAGEYLYEPDQLLRQTSLSLEHTSYEIFAFGGRVAKQIQQGVTPKYGSGDFGDVKADFAGASLGSDLYSNPEETLKNFDIKDYY